MFTQVIQKIFLTINFKAIISKIKFNDKLKNIKYFVYLIGSIIDQGKINKK
jgi:hypothetical protein